MASNSTNQTGPTSTTNSNHNSPTTTSSLVTAPGPDDVLLSMISLLYINDNSWPSDFKLDIDLDNWDEWSLRVSLLAARRGFTKWLDGSLAQPKADTHANAHRIWAINDQTFKAFILSHVSRNDYRNVSHLPTVHAVFEELRKTHKKQGLHARLVLIKKVMKIRSRPDTPLCKLQKR